MARILVLEPDPVFSAVLEDRLHVSGHAPTLEEDPARAVSAATEGHADLMIMEMALPGVSGLEVVRQLRQQSETRSLPILAVSTLGESADRVAGLRAGVDDYLSKPCDLDELLLRLDRLLGTRQGDAPAVMAGDLESHPIWGLLQYIQHSSRNGSLLIRSNKGSGRMKVRDGRIVSARWQELRGPDAVLALLDVNDGHFRLTADDADDGEPAPADAPAIPAMLMQAAWLEDQLARRGDYLPATGVPLRLVTGVLPPVDEELESVPIERVFERLKRHPGSRLYDLFNDLQEAPPRIRLAVAWLAEQGLLTPTDQPEMPVMNTTEITTSMVLDVAVNNLLTTARAAGFDTAALPYLLLAEPGVWPQVRRLPENERGYQSIESLRKLVEELAHGTGTSTTFPTEYGKLSLHVQVLEPSAKPRLEAIVPVCAGVLLWLDQAEDRGLLRGVIERLEASKDAAVGALVAQSPAATQAAAELTAGTAKWQTTSHPPRSLIGVLRLLHPRSARA